MLYSENELNKRLRSGCGLYYFYAADEALVHTAAQKALKVLNEDDPETTVLDGPAPRVEEIVLAAGTISFFGGRRLVLMPLIRPSTYSDKDLQDLCDTLADTENAANAWGSWDPKKFTVEDSAFGYIKMKNGATIFLEASWALNTLLANEAKTLLCGTKGGADMLGEGGALRINGEKYSKLYTEIPDLKASGAAFFEGVSDNPAEVEARMWIDHVKDDSKPLITKPEQAYVVTQILEAIYKSAATGETVKF